MELSTTLQHATDPRRAAEAAAALERAGPDAIRVAEPSGFDPPTTMGFLAARTEHARTEHARIGSAILDVCSRAPAPIARTAAGLDAVSGGRALLGRDAAGSHVIEGWHGKAYDLAVACGYEQAAPRPGALRHRPEARGRGRGTGRVLPTGVAVRARGIRPGTQRDGGTPGPKAGGGPPPTRTPA
ncbi:LLM class flavin-dependent oxidoreductase [Streptomyces sp. RGM 3693]|uniref:LLM class flavin-dependent oxidoreductase n=1 Tax=Streptomyces sp. RGM 3693 TaxID=3413284 RepID=UPI003D285656